MVFNKQSVINQFQIIKNVYKVKIHETCILNMPISISTYMSYLMKNQNLVTLLTGLGKYISVNAKKMIYNFIVLPD